MLTIMVSVSAVGLQLIPYDPMSIGRFPRHLKPSMKHIMGTDGFGRDVFAQLLMGILNSLQIGVTVAIAGTLVGSGIGFIAGFYGGFVDHLLRGITDIFIVIPMLPIIVLIVSSVRKTEIWMLISVLSMFAWAWPSRQVRSQTLSLKERDFIYMAKLSGMKDIEIVFKEIMPHMIQWMSANFINATLWAILTEAGLGVLGLGPKHTMTIGMMIYWVIFCSAIYKGLWWWWFPPLITLACLFLSLYLIYSGLDEIINPRERG